MEEAPDNGKESSHSAHASGTGTQGHAQTFGALYYDLFLKIVSMEVYIK
jgi:hypothetical protein